LPFRNYNNAVTEFNEDEAWQYNENESESEELEYDDIVKENIMN
jgi:hypothetical protein